MAKILVVGATGAVGSRVVSGLLEQGANVRGTTRDPGRARLAEGVEVVRADLNDPASLRPAIDGVEAVFLYADSGSPEQIVRELVDAGVRRVVLLSSWAAAKSDAEHNFNGARFWAAEQTIAASPLAWTFVRPGTFASNAARWQWEVRQARTVSLPYPESLSAPVHEQDIADVAVRALTTAELDGQGPVLTGPDVITLADQVRDIAAAIGEPVTVTPITDAESRATLARFMDAGWADYIVDSWRDAVGHAPEVSPDYGRIMGRPARSFAQWAQDNADLFR